MLIGNKDFVDAVLFAASFVAGVDAAAAVDELLLLLFVSVVVVAEVDVFALPKFIFNRLVVFVSVVPVVEVVVGVVEADGVDVSSFFSVSLLSFSLSVPVVFVSEGFDVVVFAEDEEPALLPLLLLLFVVSFSVGLFVFLLFSSSFVTVSTVVLLLLFVAAAVAFVVEVLLSGASQFVSLR